MSLDQAVVSTSCVIRKDAGTSEMTLYSTDLGILRRYKIDSMRAMFRYLFVLSSLYSASISIKRYLTVNCRCSHTMTSPPKKRPEFANKIHVATRTTCTSSSACVEVVGSSACSSVLCYDQLPASFPCYLLDHFVSSPGEDDVSFNVLIGWLVI
jgi:hypothetical protein